MCRNHPLGWSILLFGALSAPLRAQQDTTCTWDRCALRVHRNFFGTRLVRGVDGDKVAGLGMFPGALPLLAERSDSAAFHYDAFRGRQTGGNAAVLIGLAAFLAGTVLAYDDREAAGAALVIGGFTVGVIGGFVISSGQKEPSKAVWWYNRSFAPEGLPPGLPRGVGSRNWWQ